MGDADDSYDFLEIPKFVAKLREDCELVQGCRLPSGWHREADYDAHPASLAGLPMFSMLVRRMFFAESMTSTVAFVHLPEELHDRLQLRCTGMEVATEMIVNLAYTARGVAEVPITLHPDGQSLTSHT